MNQHATLLVREQAQSQMVTSELETHGSVHRSMLVLQFPAVFLMQVVDPNSNCQDVPCEFLVLDLMWSTTHVNMTLRLAPVFIQVLHVKFAATAHTQEVPHQRVARETTRTLIKNCFGENRSVRYNVRTQTLFQQRMKK